MRFRFDLPSDRASRFQEKAGTSTQEANLVKEPGSGTVFGKSKAQSTCRYGRLGSGVFGSIMAWKRLLTIQKTLGKRAASRFPKHRRCTASYRRNGSVEVRAIAILFEPAISYDLSDWLRR